MFDVILNHRAAHLYLGWFLVLIMVNVLLRHAGLERGRPRPTAHTVRCDRAWPTMSPRRAAALSRCA